MSLTSDEVNFLVYRYLLEAGKKPVASTAGLGLCSRAACMPPSGSVAGTS